MNLRQHGHRRFLPSAALLAVLLTSGCFTSPDFGPAISQFQQSSRTLERIMGTLLSHANTVESEHFIDTQTFEHGTLAKPEIESRDVITPEELALRRSAIKALSEYTVALASLASGRSEAEISKDANAASTSMSGLSKDALALGSKSHPAWAAKDYPGIISGATRAAAEILTMMEKRHSRNEIRRSIEKNDPAMKSLFEMLSNESKDIYEREKSTQSSEGVFLFQRYNTEVAKPTPDAAYLLTLSDRIKRFRRSQDLLRRSDPTPAIEAFQQAHDDLVAAIVAGDTKKPETIADVLAAVKEFSAEVEPLAANVQQMVGAI